MNDPRKAAIGNSDTKAPRPEDGLEKPVDTEIHPSKADLPLNDGEEAIEEEDAG